MFFRRTCVVFSCVTLRVAREKTPCCNKKISIEWRELVSPTTQMLWGKSIFSYAERALFFRNYSEMMTL
jgi:hypothetical protein